MDRDFKLLPCHICGSDAVIMRNEPYHKYGEFYSVQCTDCCEETECYKVPELAQIEWTDKHKPKETT